MEEAEKTSRSLVNTWFGKIKNSQFANDDLFVLFYFYLFYGYTV
jgi:hypothetical protein